MNETVSEDAVKSFGRMFPASQPTRVLVCRRVRPEPVEVVMAEPLEASNAGALALEQHLSQGFRVAAHRKRSGRIQLRLMRD
jgi:hypothetical protein